jgi:hypothetical protein
MTRKKLKVTHRGLIIFTLILVAALIAARIIYGEKGLNWGLAGANLFWTLLHFVVMIRTRNAVYIITVSYFLFAGLTFLPLLSANPLHLIFAIIAAVFLIPFLWVLNSKKINWRYNEILELAAQPVEDALDGFTPRPFPVGRIEYGRDEIRNFCRFLLRHVIAFPIEEENRVVLVIPPYISSYLIFFKRNYKKDTHIIFNDSGHISVRISERDYRTYKQELTFDQLCASLADVFIRFLKLYCDGREKEIIAQLNAV